MLITDLHSRQSIYDEAVEAGAIINFTLRFLAGGWSGSTIRGGSGSSVSSLLRFSGNLSDSPDLEGAIFSDVSIGATTGSSLRPMLASAFSNPCLSAYRKLEEDRVQTI